MTSITCPTPRKSGRPLSANTLELMNALQRILAAQHCGYPSLSYLHSAAEHAKATEKPLTIYYLGDHDRPSSTARSPSTSTATSSPCSRRSNARNEMCCTGSLGSVAA